MSTEVKFSPGSIVRARGREWVVQPESKTEMLMLKPLGGNHFETTGILPSLEKIEPSEFQLPDLEDLGDFRSSRLLREAVRLGFRNSSGPFRSFARLSVEPRPYQLVPLLMALRLDPVRLLIADDVGIGKTIEAGLIARELLDRGEVSRLAVLCPPHLAEQWQAELQEKFNLSAELVLASTVNRLERQCRPNQSIFERFPYVIVSIDYIKSDRRRDEFLRTCPELVILDEAHTCSGGGQRSSRHQRYEVVRKLAKKPNQHLILVTATPHSGKDDTFRSLLMLLNEEFAHLPENLSGEENRRYRERLARFLVQRRRADIRQYMATDTPFPERLEREESYELSAAYRQLFDDILSYVRERVKEPGQTKHHQRIRWWSALALLRSIASSPAAAAATLKTRSATVDSQTIAEADDLGRQSVMDLDLEDATEQQDMAPGAEDSLDENSPQRQRLLDFVTQAEALKGEGDIKLQKATKLVKSLLKEGHQPILFCRFIPTAEYVGEYLRQKLPKNVQIEVVTGTLPPDERQDRVAAMEESEQRVLVCTDCLSEGINLQQYFDTVIHYDLSWNPTRHEQREGRVDRYGQPQDQIRVITYYCLNNEIDPIVMKVLLRKHQAIRRALGISVPVPVSSAMVLDTIFEELIIKQNRQMEMIPGLKEQLDEMEDWVNATENEKASRSLFAQFTIKTDEVEQELQAMQRVLGSGQAVKSFVLDALEALGGTVGEARNQTYALQFKETPMPLQDRLSLNKDKGLLARFELPLRDHETYLHRTSPLVEQLAGYVLDTALDSQQKSPAARAAVIRTPDVNVTTTLLLVRFRFHLLTRRQNKDDTLLAEECRLIAFEGMSQNPTWLSQEAAEKLLEAKPSANIPVQHAQMMLKQITQNFEPIQKALDAQAHAIGQTLLESHRRVRQEAKTVTAYDVQARTPVDVLGVYLYMKG